MIQTNAIWIVENSRQLANLETLRSMLRFKEAVLSEECDIKTLPNYDMVFFLLTPTQIGNKFFIQAIEEVLRVRKSSKTIFLSIDECYRLDEQEIWKVEMELRASIKQLFTNPTVYTVSSSYAALQLQFQQGDISLDDLRQNRDVMIPTEDAGLITGKYLKDEHVDQLLPLSKMDKLYRLVDEFSMGLLKSDIDVTKENWLVIGTEKSGKSLLTEMLQYRFADSDSIRFVDTEQTPDADVDTYYDGMVVLLDPDMESHTDFLEQVCATHVGLKKIFVVNKIDNFMFYEMSRSLLQRELTKKIREYTSEPLFFVSAFYYEQYVRLHTGQVRPEDIIENSDVVLADALDFPIDKSKQKSILPELLLTHSGFNPLLHTWECQTC